MFRSRPFYIEKHIGVEVHLVCNVSYFSQCVKKVWFWMTCLFVFWHAPSSKKNSVAVDVVILPDRISFLPGWVAIYYGNSRKFTFWLQPLSSYMFWWRSLKPTINFKLGSSRNYVASLAPSQLKYTSTVFFLIRFCQCLNLKDFPSYSTCFLEHKFGVRNSCWIVPSMAFRLTTNELLKVH